MSFVDKMRDYYRGGGIVSVLRAVFSRLKWWLYDHPRQSVRANREKRKEIKQRRDNEDNYPVNERGDYHRRIIYRTMTRIIGKVLNAGSIVRNKNTRILVVLHFFYINSINEVVEYLKNLDCYNYDLIVTYPDVCDYKEMKEKILKIKKKAKFVKCDNRGYDVGPFLKVINSTNLSKYDIVIKLQTKSTNKKIFVYDQFFKDRDWFKNLWDGVIGGFSVHRTIRKLRKDSKYGLVAAENLIINDPKHKQELVRETLLNYHKIDYVDNYKFVAGSCFAIKSECLDKIRELNIGIEEFEKTKYGFFSLAHVIERAICFAGMQNYEYCGNKVDLWRHLKWFRLERRLRDMSALQITNVDGYTFSPDFVWHVLEQRFIEDFSIRKTKLSQIRRQYFDGSIINLKECEPYLFLKGDKAIYKKYSDFQRKNNLPTMTEKRFNKLIESIKKKGYDERYPIVLGRNNVIWDGQHRACVLLYLYGEDYKVNAFKLDAVEIDFSKVKPFSDTVVTIPVYY